MSDFLTASNDFVLTNGDLTLTSGSQAIAQGVLERLQYFQGEWFLDNTGGIPYFQSILVKSPNIDLINYTIQTAIVSCPGIVSLDSFNLGYDNSLRALTISFSATCTNGESINITTTVGA